MPRCRWRRMDGVEVSVAVSTLRRRPRRVRPRSGGPRLGAGGGHGRRRDPRRSCVGHPGGHRVRGGRRRSIRWRSRRSRRTSSNRPSRPPRPPDQRPLLTGNPGRALVDLAAEVDGDVTIVVGHGGSSKASLLLGSTAHYVTHHTDAAVVVVRGTPGCRCATSSSGSTTATMTTSPTSARSWPCGGRCGCPASSASRSPTPTSCPASPPARCASRGSSPTRRSTRTTSC